MTEIRHDVLNAGKMKVVMYHPVTSGGYNVPDGRKKTAKTKEQMKIENDKKAEREFVLRSNNNFDENDFIITLEYLPQYAPETESDFKKDIQRYIERVKYHRKRKGLSNKNFKYNFAIACDVFKSGIKKGAPRFHLHGFITADGMTGEELRELWKFGTKGQIERFDPYLYSPLAFAKYAAQQAKAQGRRFIHSKNCTLPVVKKRDEKKKSRISRAKLAEIAERRIDDREYWERRYPSYNFITQESVYNEINGYYYVTVYLYKKCNSNSYYERSRKNAKPNLSYAYIH